MATRPTPRSIAATLGIALTLVIACNVGAWVYLQRYPANPGVSRVWQKWQLLERLEAPVDWVFVGDSACGAGISPDLIESILGGRAVNLCTIANASVVNQAWQVARYLERFGPPKGGIIMLNAFHTWPRSADDLAGMLGQIPSAARLRHRPNLTFRQTLLFYVSPLTTLYHQDASVRHVMATLFARRRSGSVEDNLQPILRTRGHVAENRARPEIVAKQISDTRSQYLGRSFNMHPQAAEALRALLDLTQTAGFRLYVANTSIAHALWSDPYFIPFYTSMNDALTVAIGNTADAALVLRTPPTFVADEMDNIDHVVGTDAVTRFSLTVGEAVGHAARPTH